MLTALVSGIACGARRAPAAPENLPRDPVRQLHQEIERLLAAPGLERSSWALKIQSLDRDDLLYESNSGKLMMPASNMKIITVATAAERLGWDYRFETSLWGAGPLVDGTLKGDLVVRGTGDPTIGGRDGSATRTFEEWAALLSAAGIHQIAGGIIGDDNAFDDDSVGAGWAWDYLAYGYAAPSGALVYNDDVAELVVRPGVGPGDPVIATLGSETAGLTLVNIATTGAADAPDSLDMRRVPGSEVLRLTGSVPSGSAEQTLAVSVDNPTEYFVRTLRSVLIDRGIEVAGPAVDMDVLPSPVDLTTARPLAVHQSAPLTDIATVVMKVSQNLYADTLLKTMGRATGAGTAQAGRQAVADVLKGWGIDADSYVMYDGSGLSRYNYVTADVLVRILERMHDDPRHAAPFVATLPIGAQDGALARRYQGSAAAGRVRAKTGSISNVRSLSGYVQSADGESLVFSILANHFTVPQSEIDSVTDAIVEALAKFSRN